MKNIRRLVWLCAAYLIVVGSQRLSAAAIVLDFEGLGDFEEVANFYKGGTGGSGSGPGPNYGIVFGEGSYALVDTDAGGTANTANEPSPETTLAFFDVGSAIMNVEAGFDTGFSFFYAAPYFPGSVNVYDGLDSTGNLLATLALPINFDTCGGDPSGTYNCWSPIGVLFGGIAMSVNFSGTANYIAFDDITLGSDRPGTSDVPEPTTWTLLAAGTVLLARRFRRKA